MSESYVFEISEVQKEKNRWILKGLAFTTISSADILCIDKNKSNKKCFSISSINTYGREVQELVRGLTGQIVVDTDEGVDFYNIKYLYPLSLNE